MSNCLPYYVKSSFRVSILLAILFLGGIVHAQAQKDTLILKNKDRIIGEVIFMANGVLTMSSDYSDEDFKITWVDVAEMNSSRNYLIILEKGQRLNGYIHKSQKDSTKLDINHEKGFLSTTINDIVMLRPIEGSFLSRLEVSLSFGSNFTKSNSLRQLTMRSRLVYSGNTWGLNASYNSLTSTQNNTNDTRRIDANIGGIYHLRKNWYAATNAGYLSNDEQQLKRRLTTRGIIGSFLIHSNKVYLAWGSGLAWNNEVFNDVEDTRRNSLEGVAGLQLDIFDLGDIHLFSSLFAYPSITESDRVRVDFKADLKYDLPLDFFIKIGYTLNFDSQPIPGGSREDYVLYTTFGWDFN